MYKIEIFIILLVDICMSGNIKFQNRFYESSNGLLCQLCPVGKFLIKPCEKDGGESMCSVCPRGTFTNKVNFATECEECTTCRLTQYQKSPCTDTSDRVCACPPGFVWVIYRGYDGICLPACKEGEVIDIQGTSTSDTICKKAPPTTTLDTLLTSDSVRSVSATESKDDSKPTGPVTTEPLDVKNTIRNNTDQYHVSILRPNHRRPVHGIGIHRLSKPKRITNSPANLGEISTESQQRQMVDILKNSSVVNEPAYQTVVNSPVGSANETARVNETEVNAYVIETTVNAYVNETTVNAHLNETAVNAPPANADGTNAAPAYEDGINALLNDSAVNAPANDTNLIPNSNSNKNGQKQNTNVVILLDNINDITQNPLTQTVTERSTTTSVGRTRKHKRGKGKIGKKGKGRRKKNKKKKKNKRNRKCRHKVERKRQKCLRRRKRNRRRMKKSKSNSIRDHRTILK